MWSNFHTHTSWCDGKSTIEQLIDEASRLGMDALGFASHAPLPFTRKWCIRPGSLEGYLAEIRRLKEVSAVALYTGLEVDYVPGQIGPSDFRGLTDYTIGSIHFVDGNDDYRWEADTSVEIFREGLHRVFEGDVRRAVCRYYGLMREMMETSTPDILGHMDRIKMHNTSEYFFDEQASWYRDEVVNTLETARDRGVVIEINTRGLYKKRSLETYPGIFALKHILSLGIPVMLASDAHHAGELLKYFPEVSAQLYEVGFRVFRVPGMDGWREVPCLRP